MSSLLNSARWVGISQTSKIGFQLISVVVLARLLSPSDYGVMAMATVVIILAGMLREMGTGTAIIQKKNLTDSSTSTVFWLNIAMGTFIGLVLLLSSQLISNYFNEPQLKGILIVLASLFPITSATTVHQAIMERRSEFKTLAFMDFNNQAFGLALAIIAAINGAGVYSFVIPAISSAIISSIWLWSKSGWRPKLLWSKQEFSEVLGFTGNLTGFNFINYFARNADSLIIGKMLGATLLGSYALAYKLMLFPVQNLTWVVSRVMLPALSRLQDNKIEARTLYFKSLNMVVTFTAPMMLGLWVLRDPFIHSIFGNKWNLVIALLAWLAPVGLIQSAVSTTGTVFTAYGRTDILLRVGIFSTGITVLGFWIGAKQGLVAVAIGYLITNIINACVSGFYTLRTLDATVTELTKALKAPVLSAISMSISIYLLMHMLPIEISPLVKTISGAGLGTLIYLVLLTKLFGQPLSPLLKLIRR